MMASTAALLRFVRSQFANFLHSGSAEDKKIRIGPHKVGGEGIEEEDTQVVYYGPDSDEIIRMKCLHLFVCGLYAALETAIIYLRPPTRNDVILKVAITSRSFPVTVRRAVNMATFTCACATASYNWKVSPYVHKLRWQPGSDSFEVEMITWLTTYTPRTIKFSDIRPPESKRRYASFKANDNFYFVDAEHCHNEALLAKLMERASTA